MDLCLVSSYLHRNGEVVCSSPIWGEGGFSKSSFFCFELAELSQGFNCIIRYLLRIFFSNCTISSSVLEANLYAVVCAVVWSGWTAEAIYISFILAVQTVLQRRGAPTPFKSIKFIQSGDQNFTHHGMFTCNLEYRKRSSLTQLISSYNSYTPTTSLATR